MFVGVDIRSDSVLAISVSMEGAVISRALQNGQTESAVAAALRDVAKERGLPVGVACRSGERIAIPATAAAGTSGSAECPTITTGAAIALSEQWIGAARGATHVVSLSIGDHVHSGIVVDGRVLLGARGRAGDAAWLALNPVERDDYRRLGCLEAEISAQGIARRLVWRLKADDESSVLELAGGDMGAITSAHVLDAARRGDGVAVSVVRDTARYVGMAIANLVAIVDPEVVVLGGVLATAGDLLIEPARVEAIRRMSPGTTPKLVTAVLGDDGPAIGAARMAMLQQ